MKPWSESLLPDRSEALMALHPVATLITVEGGQVVEQLGDVVFGSFSRITRERS